MTARAARTRQGPERPQLGGAGLRHVGIWRIMEVLTRYGIRASAPLNSEVCDHHPEIIEEAGRLGSELVRPAIPRHRDSSG
jgi:hypothetical protein